MYLEELSQYVMHSHRVPYRRAKLQVVLELLQGGQCEVHFLRTIVVGQNRSIGEQYTQGEPAIAVGPNLYFRYLENFSIFYNTMES